MKKDRDIQMSGDYMIITMGDNGSKFAFKLLGVTSYDINMNADDNPYADISLKLLGQPVSSGENIKVEFKDGEQTVNIYDALEVVNNIEELNDIKYQGYIDKLMVSKI